MFVEESVSVQRLVQQIMATHHNRLKPHKGINGADPFVIAMAKNGGISSAIDGGPNWIVVSDEHPGTAESRKIPFVCNAEQIECITFQQMMRRERWQF